MNPSPTALVVPLSCATVTSVDVLRFLIGYLCLLTPCYSAQAAGRSSRARPVKYEDLNRSGVSDEALTWMLFQRHVDHFHAQPGASESEAWTVLPAAAVVGQNSAFAVTPLGQAFGELLIASLLLPEDDDHFEWAQSLLTVGRLTPRYDADNRLFTWGRHVLHRYRQPAKVQTTLLLVEEEMEWPRWMDDPLPVTEGIDPKIRFQDARKFLNRNQCPQLVEFEGDGTGERLGWKLR